MTEPARERDVVEEVTLVECPIGLFWHGDTLCLKTEYGNNEGRIDAYIVETGEFFWGAAPQTIASQRASLVEPIDSHEAITRLRELLEAKAPAEGEMVEKVARAIHDDRQEWLTPQKRKPWDDASDGAKTLARSQATAALASLPAPATDKMLVEAARALLAKIDADSAVRWKFVNEREGLRQALSQFDGEKS